MRGHLGALVQWQVCVLHVAAGLWACISALVPLIWGSILSKRHCRSALALFQGACCFVDVGGQRAATAEELAALLSQAPAPGAPGNSTPALYPIDHVLGGGAGGAGVKGEGSGTSGTAQRTAVLYGTPAAPCFGRMFAALEAAARADEDRPGARRPPPLGGGRIRFQLEFACRRTCVSFVRRADLGVIVACAPPLMHRALLTTPV